MSNEYHDDEGATNYLALILSVAITGGIVLFCCIGIIANEWCKQRDDSPSDGNSGENEYLRGRRP